MRHIESTTVLKREIDGLIRISRAAMKTPDLFFRAAEASMSDFNNLCSVVMSTVMGNMFFKPWSPIGFDPSFLRAGAKMNDFMMDAAVAAAGSSTHYFTGKSAELWGSILKGSESLAAFLEKQVETLDIVVNQNPAAIEAIRMRLGCQFDDTSRFVRIAETPRTVLYQVLPLKEGVKVREDGKPVIIRSPFVLSECITDLLPYDGVSYIGAFANSGTPTYFLHLKDIMQEAAVQLITEEEFLLDLKLYATLLCEHHSWKKHNRRVTVNGICQGALPLLHGVCSRALALERVVDTAVLVVPAYGLAESKRFKESNKAVPDSYRDVRSATRRLPNGNCVVPGEAPSFMIQLSNFESENPASALIRELKGAEKGPLSPAAAALRYYVQSRLPMPMSFTVMSQRCAEVPITDEGVFPSKLFGESVSLRYAVEKGINLHVVAGEKDTVVDLPCALAMFRVPYIGGYQGASYHVVSGAGHIVLLTAGTVEGARNFIGSPGGPLWYHLQKEAAGR